VLERYTFFAEQLRMSTRTLRSPLLLTVLFLISSSCSAVLAQETADARNVVLLAHVPLLAFPGGGTEGNDITGYVSPSGREYALVGMTRAVGFVDVTDPRFPSVIGTFRHTESIWADIATFEEYAYVVHDLTTPGGDGIQVFDLTQIDDGIVRQLDSSFSGGIETAHNIRINSESGFLYACGPNRGLGLWAFDLSNPTRPAFAGAWDETTISAVHDAHILTVQEGPMAGRELAYSACGASSFRILDVTDKANIHALQGRIPYPNSTFCHQVWVDSERGLAFVNDEFDELTSGGSLRTTTYIIDVSDPTDAKFLQSFTNGVVSIDHNHWGRDGFLFQANYTSGLRVWDIRDLSAIEEVGYYDTSEVEGRLQFNGAWGVYPNLPSRNVIVSDIQGGLFVLDTSAATTTSPSSSSPSETFTPNPFEFETRFKLRLDSSSMTRLDIFDSAGRRIASPLNSKLSAGTHVLRWTPGDEIKTSGTYFARIEVDSGTQVHRLIYFR